MFTFKNKKKIKININELTNIKTLFIGSINQLDIFKNIINVNNWKTFSSEIINEHTTKRLKPQLAKINEL